MISSRVLLKWTVVIGCIITMTSCLTSQSENEILFHQSDDAVRSFDVNKTAAALLNPQTLTQQRTRILDITPFKLYNLITEIKKHTHAISAGTRQKRTIWSHQETLEALLLKLYEDQTPYPKLDNAEYAYILSGFSIRWLEKVTYNQVYVSHLAGLAPADYWGNNPLMCELMLHIWLDSVKIYRLSYENLYKIANFFPCFSPAHIRDLHGRKQSYRANRGGTPIDRIYESYIGTYEGKLAPFNTYSATELVNVFMQTKSYDHEQSQKGEFLLSISTLLPYMEIRTFKNTFYRSRQELSVVQPIAIYSFNYLLLESLEHEVRQIMLDGNNRKTLPDLMSYMPNMWSGYELVQCLEKLDTRERRRESMKQISKFPLSEGQKLQVMQSYVELGHQLTFGETIDVASLVSGMTVQQISSLSSSRDLQKDQKLAQNPIFKANLSPFQTFTFVNSVQASYQKAVDLGMNYLTQYGIFREYDPNKVLSRYDYMYRNGKLDVQDGLAEPIEVDTPYSIYLLDHMKQFTLTEEFLSGSHDYFDVYPALSGTHLHTIPDHELFDIFSMMNENSQNITRDTRIQISNLVRESYDRFQHSSNSLTSKAFSVGDLKYSEITALGGDVIQHFRINEFDILLTSDWVKCRTVIAEIGRANISEIPPENQEALVQIYTQQCMRRSRLESVDLIILGKLICSLGESLNSVSPEVLMENFYSFDKCSFTYNQAKHMHNKLSTIKKEGKELDLSMIVRILGNNICLVFSTEEVSAIFEMMRGSSDFNDAIFKAAASQNDLPDVEKVRECARVFIVESLNVINNDPDIQKPVIEVNSHTTNSMITCARLKHINAGIQYLDPEYFTELTEIEFERCIEYLSHNEHITDEQSEMLFNHAIYSGFIGAHSFSDITQTLITVQKMGDLVKYFPDYFIDFIDETASKDTIYQLGKLTSLSSIQRQTYFNIGFKFVDSNEFTIENVKMFGNLLCGANYNILNSYLSEEVVLATVQDLGQLEGCTTDQYSVIWTTLVRSSPVKKSANMLPSMIYMAGAVVSGISRSELQSFSQAQLERVSPSAFLNMPPQTLQYVSMGFYQRLSVGQLEALYSSIQKNPNNFSVGKKENIAALMYNRDSELQNLVQNSAESTVPVSGDMFTTESDSSDFSINENIATDYGSTNDVIEYDYSRIYYIIVSAFSQTTASNLLLTLFYVLLQFLV